ncbi:hypothetical protein [Providencia phage PSTCR6]|nr:hypothetical protein [Providencia phage PSTCR6]
MTPEKYKKITLIGSREVPSNIAKYQKIIGKKLSSLGVQGFSGDAKGSDKNFLLHYSENLRTIIKPEKAPNLKGFYSFDSFDQNIKDKARKIVEVFCPDLSSKSVIAQKLLTRNAFQVLGLDLESPTDAVLFYAPEDKYGNVKGGTRVAVRIARAKGIPTFNMYDQKTLDKILKIFEIRDVPNFME